jgi:putative phosphoesterase
MRILVVADIHGNRSALEALREPHDLCVCLGDIVDYGPEPAACVDWVREHATHCVRGNHDHGAAQDVVVQGVAGFRYLTAVTRPLTVAALNPDRRRYLADLPTTRMFSAGGKRFLMVHATPRDPMDEYAAADAEFWAPLVAGLHTDYLLVGHTHQPYTLRVNGTLVVNPGSVGLSRDGDPRAAYAVIEGDDVQLKRAEYAPDEMIAKVDETVGDPTARAMLADIYRGGVYLARWAQAKNGNGKANGNGKPAQPPATGGETPATL